MESHENGGETGTSRYSAEEVYGDLGGRGGRRRDARAAALAQACRQDPGGLPAHVEALRSEARTYEMACPVHAEGWTLVLTAASSRKVWVSFMRDGAGTGETGIDVGSSAQAADCTIAALGSHPARWGDAPGAVRGSALLAAQCPDGGR